MTVKIAIIGDTHVKSINELPKKMIKEIKESDWVIHVGDYTFLDVLNGLIDLKGNYFRGVYGNADPKQIWDKVPLREIIEIKGKRIGITHPASGGSHENIETKVIEEFKKDNVDVIIFGHTHDPIIHYKENIIIINPGKGYLEKHYYGAPTTIAILEIDGDIRASIKEIKS
jgi:putative phosphoesterase